MLTIQTDLRQVAENQFQKVTEQFEEQLEANGIFDGDGSSVEMPNLYVYSGGSVEIEFPDFLQDHNYVTMAPLAQYRNVNDLLRVLEENYAPDKESDD